MDGDVTYVLQFATRTAYACSLRGRVRVVPIDHTGEPIPVRADPAERGPLPPSYFVRVSPSKPISDAEVAVRVLLGPVFIQCHGRSPSFAYFKVILPVHHSILIRSPRGVSTCNGSFQVENPIEPANSF